MHFSKKDYRWQSMGETNHSIKDTDANSLDRFIQSNRMSKHQTIRRGQNQPESNRGPVHKGNIDANNFHPARSKGQQRLANIKKRVICVPI